MFAKFRPHSRVSSLFLTFIAAFLYSCGENNPSEIDYYTQLYLPVTELEFNSENSYLNLEVISSGNITWHIISLPEWLSASPIQSSVSENVRVTAAANNGEERKAIFIVKSISEAFPVEWKVSVTQKKRIPNSPNEE